jgi:hypothetical protein
VPNLAPQLPRAHTENAPRTAGGEKKSHSLGSWALIFQTELTSFGHTGYWWDVSYFAQIPEEQRVSE